MCCQSAAARVAASRRARQLRWTVTVRSTVVDWYTQNIHVLVKKIVEQLEKEERKEFIYASYGIIIT